MLHLPKLHFVSVKKIDQIWTVSKVLFKNYEDKIYELSQYLVEKWDCAISLPAYFHRELIKIKSLYMQQQNDLIC